MRYYDLQISPPGSAAPYRRWQSHPDGKFNPRAQNIEFDALLMAFNAPAGATTITVHGVSLDDLKQANSWGLHAPSPGSTEWVQGMDVTLRGGMQAGLPLANPQQAGLLLSGQIVQAFGNWEGTEQSLDMVVQPVSYSVEMPGNIVLNWKKGTTLETALRNCLQIAFPTIPLIFNISSNLVLNYDQVHMVGTLMDLATWIYQFTEKRFANPVTIAVNGGSIAIMDTTYRPTPVQVKFTDLIGQPVWIEPGVMQAKFVMRADLQIGSYIQMPQGLQDLPGIALTRAASSPSQLRTHTTFPGQFKVVALRHIGNFRSPEGADWATVANCLSTPGTA